MSGERWRETKTPGKKRPKEPWKLLNWKQLRDVKERAWRDAEEIANLALKAEGQGAMRLDRKGVLNAATRHTHWASRVT